jgi:hypothetical protein
MIVAIQRCSAWESVLKNMSEFDVKKVLYQMSRSKDMVVASKHGSWLSLTVTLSTSSSNLKIGIA